MSLGSTIAVLSSLVKQLLLIIAKLIESHCYFRHTNPHNLEEIVTANTLSKQQPRHWLNYIKISYQKNYVKCKLHLPTHREESNKLNLSLSDLL